MWKRWVCSSRQCWGMVFEWRLGGNLQKVCFPVLSVWILGHYVYREERRRLRPTFDWVRRSNQNVFIPPTGRKNTIWFSSPPRSIAATATIIFRTDLFLHGHLCTPWSSAPWMQPPVIWTWYHCTATRCCPRMKGELLGTMERCQFSSFQERSRTTFWPLKPTVGDWWKAEFAGNLNRGKER